jgi:hypothetical protein
MKVKNEIIFHRRFRKLTKRRENTRNTKGVDFMAMLICGSMDIWFFLMLKVIHARTCIYDALCYLNV